MEERRFHAVNKIHSHRDFMDHLKLLLPHKVVIGQEIIQGSVSHVLHNDTCSFAAYSVNGHDVLEL